MTNFKKDLDNLKNTKIRISSTFYIIFCFAILLMFLLKNSDILCLLIKYFCGPIRTSLMVKNNGILVPVRTSFGLRRCGGKTYNVST